MAKYKVLKTFKDKETKEVYRPGKEIDITKKRAEEIDKKLKGYLEEVPEGPKKKKGD